MNEPGEEELWRDLRGRFAAIDRLAPGDLGRSIADRRNEGRKRSALGGLLAGAVVLLAVVLGANRLGLAQSLGGGAPSEGQLRQEAAADLGRWADAVAAAATRGPVITGALTGQIGEWEPALADAGKVALEAGRLTSDAGLPTEEPGPGVVRWSDGSSAQVTLESAAAALTDLSASAPLKCPDCSPLEVTAASLQTVEIGTSKGLATVPAWVFAVSGTEVRITRVAVSNPVVVAPPTWNPSEPAVGISVERAIGDPASAQLVVTFTGAPQAGDQECGADYSAQAVESDLAIVIIILEHRNGDPCRLVGATRTASVQLAAPLGGRVVLEVKEGLPVPVIAP